MGNRNNTKAFTLIELLTVIILLGLIITLAIPTLRNLTYNGAEKQYQYHQQLVHEAAKLYAKNYRGELANNDSSCFNIPYYALLQEDLIEEEDIKCSGSIILEKRGRDGYNYNYYLTCKDVSGEVLHQSDPIPLSCKGVSGNFKVSYQLYQNNGSGRTPYTEGDWAKEVYAEYNASSPYNYPVDYFEYSVDFINWKKIEDHSQNYTNYVGNVFIRAVDKGENVSEVIRHLIRTDSAGPTFTLKSNENEISDNSLISISVDNVQDTGVGVDDSGNSYSTDGVNWSPTRTWSFPLNGTLTVYTRDRLGNVSSQQAQVIKACNGRGGTVTPGDIVSGKTLWVNGEKVTGTMTDNGGINRVLNPGDTFTIPVGYHNGTGKITVNSMINNTSATATSDQILSGKTAWVNGEKVTGTMRNSSQGNKILSSGENYTLAAGYHDGKEIVRVKTFAEQTVGDTTADNLPLGVTAWVNGVQIVGTGSDKNSWYQQGVEAGNSRCTAKLTNMETYANFINSGVQSQYLIYTVETSNYTKLSIGNITTSNVDDYSIRLTCSGSTSQTITAHANETIDITPYNSVTVTIEIQKDATLDDNYLGGEDNPPKIMISYMHFD